MSQYISVYTIKCQSQSFHEIFEQDFTKTTMSIDEFDARVAGLSGTCQAYREQADCNRLLMKMARYLVTTFPDNNI